MRNFFFSFSLLAPFFLEDRDSCLNFLFLTRGFKNIRATEQFNCSRIDIIRLVELLLLFVMTFLIKK